VIVTTQAPVPLQPRPVQPPNLKAGMVGVAVNVTTLPGAKVPEQIELLQLLIPAGDEETLFPEAPRICTVGFTVKSAVTKEFPVTTTLHVNAVPVHSPVQPEK
jgi:hypothetical protein